MRMRATKRMSYRTRRLVAADEDGVFEERRPKYQKIWKGANMAEELPPEPKQPASELYRMRKADLAAHLRDRGEPVDDENATRQELLDRALAARDEP